MKKHIILVSGLIMILSISVKSYSQNSVLSTGEWIKIAAQNTGIHQITYGDLVSYGIDPGDINPKNLQIYGNGNGMLPESTAQFRYEDLQELSVLVYGEEDSSFDPGDYLLFYGEAPTEWNFDETSGLFEHQVNYYSGNTCYFLTASLGPGKRIEIEPYILGQADYTSTQVNDYYFHELELENMIHSGKMWFGERFEEELQYEFQINCPNITSGSPARLIASSVARSSEISSFGFEINSQPAMNIDIPGVNMNNSTSYGRRKVESCDFYTDNPIVTLLITYNKPTEYSTGWLDYFSINYRRNNNFGNGQMNFRDVESIGQGLTEFQVLANTDILNIWNVTDPLNPSNIDFAFSNGTAEFKLETNSLLEFIAFDQSQFFTPQFIGAVENQNLHGINPPDMVIVSHPDFLNEAQQLADFREAHDGLTCLVTTPEKIYNEFSSGSQDLTAIRDFMKHLYEKSNGEKPDFLLLFGDGSYDYKNIDNDQQNLVPAWETLESLNEVSSYCSDDFFGEFDEVDKYGNLKMGIGRIPAKTPEEANTVVEKIIHYSSDASAFGNWRNEIVSIADDEDNNLHLAMAEELALLIDTTNFAFNLSKIYLDAYVQDTLENGNPVYPDVNQDITDHINAGVNIINYVGHGSYNGLAHEQILTEDDMENWENEQYYPLLYTATGNFGKFDDPEKYSMAEKGLLLENKGLSSVVAPTRATYASNNGNFMECFYKNIVGNPWNSIGKNLKQTKLDAGNAESGKYIFFGDPSMRLAIPEFKIITEAVNGIPAGQPMDTINPGEEIIVSGYLEDAMGNPFYNFNGSLNVKVFDRIDTVWTLGNDLSSMVRDFTVRDSVITELESEILNGQFAFSFNLPYDLEPEFGTIKLSYYAMDFPLDAHGYFSDLVVGGAPNIIYDNVAVNDLFEIYPTLVENNFNLKAKKEIDYLDVAIYDITGRQVMMKTFGNLQAGSTTAIDLSSFHPGMFIVMAKTDQAVITQKIIKK
ncbi:MAG: type IX secretion system sortase PorU [Bacteroidales bacterium]|nr:type IX secretion system sortase PorU [Bacteroidales bacterium]